MDTDRRTRRRSGRTDESRDGAVNRTRFVQLALAAFGLVFASFVVRGTTRLFAPYELAVALSAPLLFAAAVVLGGLVVLATLDATGIRPLE